MLVKDLISEKIATIGLLNTADLWNIDQNGAIIILQMRENNYALSEIARIVENENAKILNAVAHLNVNELLYIVLKINSENIHPILKSFERFGYEINSYFVNDIEDSDIFQERLNEFLHYINI